VLSDVLTISDQNGAIVGSGITAWSSDDAYGKTDLGSAHGAFAAHGITSAAWLVTSGNRKVQSFTCMDQYLCMAFAQLTFRESLRDIEACLRSQNEKLYPHGNSGARSRNTLANRERDAGLADLCRLRAAPDRHRRKLYVNEPFGVDLPNTAYALDSTTIGLVALALFPWAAVSNHEGAVKMHTLLDLRGNIPSFIHISDGKMHDVNILDQLIPEAGVSTSWNRGHTSTSTPVPASRNQLIQDVHVVHLAVADMDKARDHCRADRAACASSPPPSWFRKRRPRNSESDKSIVRRVSA